MACTVYLMFCVFLLLFYFGVRCEYFLLPFDLPFWFSSRFIFCVAHSYVCIFATKDGLRVRARTKQLFLSWSHEIHSPHIWHTCKIDQTMQYTHDTHISQHSLQLHDSASAIAIYIVIYVNTFKTVFCLVFDSFFVHLVFWQNWKYVDTSERERR